MSALTLDHVVIVVADLAQAIADYRASGFTVVEGGSHPGRPTRNVLVVFEDGAYLELIKYDAPAPQERWWRVLSAQGAGLVDFALLPRDLPLVVAAAHGRGLSDMTGPHEGSRLRPDGARLEWQTARQARHDLPFLCADVSPRALRVPEGQVRRHANGVTGVAEIEVAVADLTASVERYRALLGPGVEVKVEGPGASAQLAGTRITLLPDPPSRGEGPRALRLRLAAGSPALAMDASRAHGVRFLS